MHCCGVSLYFELFLCSLISSALLRGFAVLWAVFMLSNFGCALIWNLGRRKVEGAKSCVTSANIQTKSWYEFILYLLNTFAIYSFLIYFSPFLRLQGRVQLTVNHGAVRQYVQCAIAHISSHATWLDVTAFLIDDWSIPHCFITLGQWIRYQNVIYFYLPRSKGFAKRGLLVLHLLHCTWKWGCQFLFRCVLASL